MSTEEIGKGSRVIITDIHEEDAYYPDRDKLVGSMGYVCSLGIRKYIHEFVCCQIKIDGETHRTSFFAIKIVNADHMTEEEIEELRFLLCL